MNCPSLVLIKERGGQEVASVLLDKTWDLVSSGDDALRAYIEGETMRFLGRDGAN